MANNVELKKLRNNVVTKNNELIQNGKMNTSLIEDKALSYLISKIKPGDDVNKKYIFNCKEFQVLLNWNDDASYKNIKIMLKNLGDRSAWIKDGSDDKKETLIRWFNVVDLNTGNGDIEVSFHEKIFPFLMALRTQEEINFFTSYKLQNIALMKHRYSVKLYELLKSYQFNNKKWTFEFGTGSEYDIQLKIAEVKEDSTTKNLIPVIPKRWLNWALFKKDVLDPAVEDINKYSDIKVDFVGKKEDIYRHKTKGIKSIEFYMVQKTSLEQQETNDVIDVEYGITAEISGISAESIFFKNHEESLQKENEAKKQEIEKEKLKNTRYPLLFDTLSGRGINLSEDKLDYVYHCAIKNRVAGKVEKKNWEIFATDLISHYYDKIKATPEETKTSEFKRLCDCVTKDYDQVVGDILMEWGRH